MMPEYVNELIPNKINYFSFYFWVITFTLLAAFLPTIPAKAWSSYPYNPKNPPLSEIDRTPTLLIRSESLFPLVTFPPCENPGWFPEGFGLKDHHSYWYDGYYYLVSNQLPDEKRFAVGRSVDLCEWEIMTPILSNRLPGTWDEHGIWAPYIHEEDGIFYLFYTGVTNEYTQSIMLATSTNPSDPNSWQTQGVVFQPNHGSAIWQEGNWADCRDPTVIKIGNTYYMYYTGRDVEGGIIGIASSISLHGPWQDWGRVFPPSNDMYESPTIIHFGNYYYLFYHLTSAYSKGEYYRISESPFGPWQPPIFLPRGWAHEFWRNPNGVWYTSFLTDYTISISTITWDNFFQPPLLIMGDAAYHLLLPLIFYQTPL